MEYTHMFQDDETVEINEGGHFGTYYRAKIIGRIGAEQDYLYKVQCLCRKDANGTPLVQNVHISRIRPYVGQLDESTKPWEVNDIVDALDSSNGAWRAGILTKIDWLPVTRFTVKLSDQTEMSTQFLRYHSDWFHRPCYVFYSAEIIANGNGYHHDDPQDIDPQDIDPLQEIVQVIDPQEDVDLQEIDPQEEIVVQVIDPQEVDPQVIEPHEMEPQEIDPPAILLQVIDAQEIELQVIDPPPGNLHQNGHHHNDNQENDPPGIGHQNGH